MKIRAISVKSSATDFGAKVDAADFDAWLQNTIGTAFESGYKLARQQG